MKRIKISKSGFFKICLIAGLIFSAQFSFATIVVPIPKDGGQKTPPAQTNSLTQELSASATLDETALNVYFEYGVGDATVTVYDADNNVVAQEVADTESTSEVSIAVSSWATGDYMITVTYGTTTQRGYFSIE